MMIEAVSNLFMDKLLDDNREPIRTFTVPGLDGTYGLYAPTFELWKQLIALVTICQIFQVFFSIIIYKGIIPNRGTISSYLLGWGIIIPLCLYIPFELLEILDVRNQVLKLCVTCLPSVVVFRTIEAMYDTSPPVVESTLTNYIIYYTATIHHIWDTKTKTRVKVTTKQFVSNFFRVTYYYHLLSLSLSFMMHHNFTPFHSSPVVLDDFHLNLDILKPSHIGNAYCLAVHVYFHLLVGFEMTNFGENIKGYVTKPTFLNPLWTSKSPTDFWSRKWNLMIHNILKGGSFLPAKKFVSTPIAIFITFILSGLVHDYVWACIFYHYRNDRDTETGICHDCFTQTNFKLTAFFLWNGIVMLLENFVGKFPPFIWCSTYLPLPIVSTLVLFTALPVSHWYTGDWAVSGYFSDFSVGLWHIKKLS